MWQTAAAVGCPPSVYSPTVRESDAAQLHYMPALSEMATATLQQPSFSAHGKWLLQWAVFCVALGCMK